jgi:hypothetical protein
MLNQEWGNYNERIRNFNIRGESFNSRIECGDKEGFGGR